MFALEFYNIFWVRGLTFGKYCVSRLLMDVLKYLLLSELLEIIRLAGGGVAVTWDRRPLSIPRSRTGRSKKKKSTAAPGVLRKWMYDWNHVYATSVPSQFYNPWG